jgi:arabinofuranosyltransferase
VVLVWGLLAVDTPPLLSGAGFGAQAVGAEIVDHDGVTDERRFYYPSMGLLPRLGFTREWREISWIDTGNAVRTRTTAPQVIAASNVGMFGFYAGPAVHVIDRNALCDPLLSRLPPRTPWRIGHFTRELPAGYLEGWRSGTNGLVDPGLRQFYERIRRVTQGPVWSIARFRDMFVLLLRSADGL